MGSRFGVIWEILGNDRAAVFRILRLYLTVPGNTRLGGADLLHLGSVAKQVIKDLDQTDVAL